MPKGKANQDTETLEMALVGFEQKKIEIEEKIKQIKSLLGTAPVAPKKTNMPETLVTGVKRTLSAVARKRIAAAQKKRWADFHKSKAEAAK